MDDRDFNILEGKVLKSVNRNGDEEIIFTTVDGDVFKMYHDQDCCEGVSIDDICGDLDDLIGSPIVRATEDTNYKESPDDLKHREEDFDSFTWTFYNIATNKGHVTIRWLGESNGYYSESVDFILLKRKARISSE